MLFKTYRSCPVLPQDSKMSFFGVRQLEMPKLAVQKSDVIRFTWFLGHCTARNKYISLKFCTLVVGIYFYTKFSGFYVFKNFDFVGVYFWKRMKFWFLVVIKTIILKIRESHLVEGSIWHLLVFFSCVLLQHSTFY